MTRLFGWLLIAAGIAGFAFGGIVYRQQKDEHTIGPIEVRHVERRSIPIPPIAAASALLAGAILVAGPWRRRTLDR